MSMLPCSMAQVGVVIVPREQVLRHSIVTLRIFPTIAHVKAGIPVATVFKLLPLQMKRVETRSPALLLLLLLLSLAP